MNINVEVPIDSDHLDLDGEDIQYIIDNYILEDNPNVIESIKENLWDDQPEEMLAYAAWYMEGSTDEFLKECNNTEDCLKRIYERLKILFK